MNPASPITAAALALKERHAALLRPSDPVAAESIREGVAALDAARERLQGGPRADEPQLTLDDAAWPA